MADEEKTDTKTKSKAKDGEAKKKSPMMLILLLVVGIVGGVVVSKMMGGSSAPVAEPPPEAGEIATIEPININLADGHFLRISVGAQLTKKVPEKAEAWVKVESPKVTDAMIKVFSGQPLEHVRSTEGREELVKELEELVMENTEKQVMKVYLGEYVSQ
jgi:flagellar protein FliL